MPPHERERASASRIRCRDSGMGDCRRACRSAIMRPPPAWQHARRRRFDDRPEIRLPSRASAGEALRPRGCRLPRVALDSVQRWSRKSEHGDLPSDDFCRGKRRQLRFASTPSRRADRPPSGRGSRLHASCIPRGNAGGTRLKLGACFWGARVFVWRTDWIVGRRASLRAVYSSRRTVA